MERVKKLEMKVAELKRDARSLMKVVQPVQLRALTDYFLAQHRSSADEDKSGAPWNSYSGTSTSTFGFVRKLTNMWRYREGWLAYIRSAMYWGIIHRGIWAGDMFDVTLMDERKTGRT
jgi:hypothetical protein